MARRLPPDMPVPAPPAERVEWVVHLKTITPMFGGSATPREVDERYPIRASSVRGHLRFWWRATNGARYASSKELFKAEEEIWGSASKEGKVRVEISFVDIGHEYEPIRHEWTRSDGKPTLWFDPSCPKYALFPFQGNNERRNSYRYEPPETAHKDIIFSIKVICEEAVAVEIKMALRAWVMFGGIGSRTRRGCGSLEFLSPLQAQLSDRVDRKNSLLTILPATYFCGKQQADPVDAWRMAVDAYQDFRQGIFVVRRFSGGTPRRSLWPEPDTIRWLKQTWLKVRDQDGRVIKSHSPTHSGRFFPRADLGLPIIYKFKDGYDPGSRHQDHDNPNDYDPETYLLRGDTPGATRFSSPIITKVLSLDGFYYPIVMILDSPRIWEGGAAILVNTENAQDKTRISAQELQSCSPFANKQAREGLAAFLLDPNGTKPIRQHQVSWAPFTEKSVI